MSEPIHADGWYQPPDVDELRQEIQNLYEVIQALEARIKALEDAGA